MECGPARLVNVLPSGAARRTLGRLASREQQVLPAHRPCPVGVAPCKLGKISVKRGNPVRVVGNAVVDGDRGSIARLEVVTKLFRLLEVVDTDGLPVRDHIGYAVAEQITNVVLVAPQRRRLRARGRWRGVRLHGSEHLADEAFRSPAQQPDRPAWTADPDQLVGTHLVVRREHDPDAGHHDVELVVCEGQRLGIGLTPLDLDASLRGQLAANF